ncbi:MAG TPA: Gfo/Idh/MocA family oxidoreductase [bacterium]|nr:Gfo/Idh/MocA family oxidoreductase [bacterium]
MASRKQIRYAVVGLGYISQSAVLPAFAHAAKNSRLTALVSDDPLKLKRLGKKYRVSHLFGYEEYEACLRSGEIDAVYIALPNNMHRDYTVRAADAGIHVLCEKPMAVSADDCEKMIAACERNRVKLMIAYRLHFEKANLKAIALAKSGKLGDPRIFDSLFTMQVKAGNIRLEKGLGGGTLYDIGIYCINAARNLFGSEPMEATAIRANNGEKRFREVDEMTGAVLRFPGERLATFVSSFGAADVSEFRLIGTKGTLKLDRAYEIGQPKVQSLSLGKRQSEVKYAKSDQFAPELLHFSDCILSHRKPVPSGIEGLADVRIIEALLLSAETGKSISLRPFDKRSRPNMNQEINRPPVTKQELVHAEAPSA